MAAASFDLAGDSAIEIGAKYVKDFLWKDSDGNAISLAGYEARMQIRQTVPSGVILLELTTSNGRIVLEPDGEVGVIRLQLLASETEVIDWSTGFYDLELVITADPDDVTRLLEGRVRASPNVTRS